MALALGLLAQALASAQDRAVPPQERRVAPVAANDSGRRIALVVGNRDYSRTKALANPVNDATDLAAALRRAGFEVQLALNTSRRELERDIAEFTQRLRPGDAALFYFSGHGMQAEGENYLLPVDFEALAEADVKYSAYSAARLLDNMKARGARINILILDACRDNPYRSLRGGSGGGLGAMGGSGSYIAFAAEQGKTADDNPGQRNGLFTKHLLAVLDEKGLPLDTLFNRVRQEVNRESGGRQTPFTYSGVLGEFYFHAPVVVPPPPPPPVVDTDAEVYVTVKDSTDPAVLDEAAAKIRNNPKLADALRSRAESLREAHIEAEVFATVKDSTDPAVLDRAAAKIRDNPKLADTLRSRAESLRAVHIDKPPDGQPEYNLMLPSHPSPPGLTGTVVKVSRGELNLSVKVGNELDPQRKVALIAEWEKKYPDSKLKLNREQELLRIVHGAYGKTASPQLLEAARDAATRLAEDFSSAEVRPPRYTDQQWADLKHDVLLHVHAVLGWVAMTNKDDGTAAAEFRSALQVDPTLAQVSYWLGTVLIRRNASSQYSEALYEIARAVSISGSLALQPASKGLASEYLKKTYTTYHGSETGLDQLLQAVQSAALPPAGFHIDSVADLAKAP